MSRVAFQVHFRRANTGLIGGEAGLQEGRKQLERDTVVKKTDPRN
jgi:hypothetical protein